MFKAFYSNVYSSIYSNTCHGSALRVSTAPGEHDDGDYATLRGPNGDLLHMMAASGGGAGRIHHQQQQPQLQHHPQDYHDHADDTSEEGKLLACVRDDSVTYASTRDLEPPITSATLSPATSYITSPEHLMSPVSVVTVHSNEVRVSVFKIRLIGSLIHIPCRLYISENLRIQISSKDYG